MNITEDSVFPLPSYPLENPGLWSGGQFAGRTDWVTPWPDDALEDLLAACRQARHKGLEAGSFGREDFATPQIEELLGQYLQHLEGGSGFLLLRGLPLDDLSDEEAETLFWGLMVHLGTPLSQNKYGHRLGHVRDLGLDPADLKVRNYQTTAELFFHNDSCDVLMLACRRTARSGGVSRLASIPALFNALWAEDAALTKELFRPFAFDRRGEPGRPDEADTPYYVLPVFNYHEGYLTARMTPRSYIDSAQRFDGAPRLSDAMNAALDLMEEVVQRPEVSFEFHMRPGDIQLINNYCVFHSRTPYEDWEEPSRKRHLLRAWLSVPNSRPLPPWYKNRWGAVESGVPRGGIYASGA